jgi:predicted ATP-dependent endonuclease of OLD family
MRIKQLRLKNFRGIKNLELNFGATSVVVLVGINGAGKSSILDAIGSLVKSYGLIAEVRVLDRLKLWKSFSSEGWIRLRSPVAIFPVSEL